MLDDFPQIVIMTTHERWAKFQPNLEARLKELGAKDWFVFFMGGAVEDKVTHHVDEAIPDGWTGRPQSWNYWRSIWKVVNMAKAMKWPFFLFLEDDADFQPNFAEAFPKASDELPDGWHMFYLGGNHHFSRTYRLSEHILECTCTLDMHAVAIHSRVYDTLLAFREAPWLKENPYADGTIAHKIHPLGHSYCCTPSLVWQHDGWSGNENRYISRKENWQHNGNMVDLRQKEN